MQGTTVGNGGVYIELDIPTAITNQQPQYFNVPSEVDLSGDKPLPFFTVEIDSGGGWLYEALEVFGSDALNALAEAFQFSVFSNTVEKAAATQAINAGNGAGYLSLRPSICPVANALNSGLPDMWMFATTLDGPYSGNLNLLQDNSPG